MEYSVKEVLLLWGALIACVVVYVLIREKINLRRASTGKDKNRIAGIFKQLLPDTWGNYKLVYACWEKSDYQPGKTVTHYWSYAIAFTWVGIYVVPLLCEDGEIRYKESFYIDKESLGMVNGKKGKGWMTLYDKNQEEILTLEVKAENTKSDRFHPVNIVQKEEAADFSRLVDNWLDDVNGRNGVTVSGRYGKPFAEK